MEKIEKKKPIKQNIKPKSIDNKSIKSEKKESTIIKPKEISKTEIITDESVEKYMAIRQEFKDMKTKFDNDSNEDSAISKNDDNNDDDDESCNVKVINVNEYISIDEHKEKIKEIEEMKDLRISQLISELTEKTKFLKDNLEKLEHGQIAYEESKKMYEEMVVEYKNMMINTTNYMENERKTRLDKLKKLASDIRTFEYMLDFYRINGQFFISLGELNNVIKKFEDNINKGIGYKDELNYLLVNLPETFVSRKLLRTLHDFKETTMNTNNDLLNRFSLLEKSLRETSLTPKNTNSLLGNLLAKFTSMLLFSEKIDRKGNDNNSKISRAGFALKNGNLEQALYELDTLDEDILYPAQDWMKSARKRLYGEYAIKVLKSELLSRSVKINNDDE